MRYIDFRTQVEQELRANPDGLTWLQLKERLSLPYKQPCYTWISQMEAEIGLTRRRQPGGMVWTLAPDADPGVTVAGSSE